MKMHVTGHSMGGGVAVRRAGAAHTLELAAACAGMPPGWRRYEDAESGLPYYYHEATGDGVNSDGTFGWYLRIDKGVVNSAAAVSTKHN